MPFPEADVTLKATTEVRPLTRLPPSGKNRISTAGAWDEAGEVGDEGEDGDADEVGEVGEDSEADEDGDVGEVEGVEEGEVGEVSEVEYRVFRMVSGCMK